MLHTGLETGDIAPQRSSASMDRTIPQGIVRLLPPSAFASRSFQDEEDAAIWTRVWVAAGFAAEIPNTGDVLPFTVGNHGIHIERCGDGTLAGRFNKAQHGGCRTVPLQCQTGAKTKCSFTACGYSRDRRPIGAGDVDRDATLDQYLGLRPERLLTVPVTTWGSLLLVQIDPAAKAAFSWPRCEATFGGSLALDDDGAAATRWIEYEANWKHIAVCLAAGRLETAEPSHAKTEAHIPTTLLFPNVVIIGTPRLQAVVILQPTALGRTLCRIRLFGSSTASTSDAARRDLLAVIAARAAHAEARQQEAADATDDSAIRVWFETKVLAARDALYDETRTDPLYSTRDKGGW